MTPAGFLILGSALLLSNLGFRINQIKDADWRLFTTLHQHLRKPPWIQLFRLLWPAGRTEFLLVVLVCFSLVNPILGLSSAISYIIWGVIDQGFKRIVNRNRPFDCLPDTEMLQPKTPKDSSFPSGDTFHVWFLLIIAMQVFHPSIPAITVLIILAILISLGRIAMGVHFPTDVLGGAGMGIAAAGMGLLINQVVIFILGNS